MQVTDMDLGENTTFVQQQQQQQRNHDSTSRVTVTKVSSCQTLSGGVVVALNSSSSSSSSAIATEALGSVTVLKALRSAAGQVQLLSVGADRSGLMVTDVVTAAARRQTTSPTDQVGPPAAETAVAEAVDSSPAAAHQAVLVATHPQGLMLLQRDLSAEQQHQQSAHEAALQLWEAGGHRPELWAWQQQQQQGELLAAAVQPWLGAGEAAPWAAAGAPGRPTVRRQRLTGQQTQPTGAAASGSADVGIVDPGASQAPRLLPSAACAPAAGVTVMCAAQLGLHVQKVEQLGPQEDSSSSNDCLSSSNPPIWCFSPNGAVSVVHLLQAQEAQELLLLQKQHLSQQQTTSSLSRLLRLQPDASSGCLGLFELHKLGPPSSYRNYQRVRGAADAWNDEQADAEDKLPFNCVDGDLLFAHPEDAEPTRLLQFKLWQSVL